MEHVLLNISRIFTVFFFEFGGYFVSVFLLAAKVLGVYFLYPGVHGERVRPVICEKRNAVGDFRSYALDFHKRFFKVFGRKRAKIAEIKPPRKKTFACAADKLRTVAVTEFIVSGFIVPRQIARRGKRAIIDFFKGFLLAVGVAGTLYYALYPRYVVVLRDYKRKQSFAPFLIEYAYTLAAFGGCGDEIVAAACRALVNP